MIEDRATGETREATLGDVQKILSDLGLELVPIGTVNWGEHPDSAIMKTRIELLTAALAALKAT